MAHRNFDWAGRREHTIAQVLDFAASAAAVDNHTADRHHTAAVVGLGRRQVVQEGSFPGVELERFASYFVAADSGPFQANR